MPDEVPRQLALDLGHRPRLGRDDFLVTPANAATFALVTAFPAWPDRGMLLVGPAASGKTHLAGIWAEQAGAPLIAARTLDPAAPPPLGPGGRLAVDDIDDAEASEEALFHLLNAMRELGGALLLVARTAPTLVWPRLPDLASRLRALPVAALGAADEALVRAVLVKLFDDRQLLVDAGLVDYIARRVDRSLDAVRRLVDELDRRSLERGRPINRPAVAAVLSDLAMAEGDGDEA